MKLTTPCLFLVAVFLTGCILPPRPQPVAQRMKCKVPEITAMPETDYAPIKGGVRISIAPVSYKAEAGSRTTRRQTPKPGFFIDPDPRSGPKVFYDEVTETTLKTTPERLQFTIKINNTLSRVFRGAGTVVQFNVGGKLMSVDQTGYGEMLGAIVPPQGEHQLTISGPKIENIPDNGTLGIFFYDVVTATDVAGNVTEKQNFIWYYKYETKVVEQDGQATTVKNFMPASQWRP